MKAIQLIQTSVVELPQPKAATGQVLLKVTTAGLLYTDIGIPRETTSLFPAGQGLGHDIADSGGNGVSGWKAVDVTAGIAEYVAVSVRSSISADGLDLLAVAIPPDAVLVELVALVCHRRIKPIHAYGRSW